MPRKRPPPAPSGETPPDDLQAIFGQNLRTARLRAGRTQGDIADAAGTTPQYIQKIERGGINVTLGTMQAIAASLGLDARAMLVRWPPEPGAKD